MKLRKYTELQLREAIASSISINQTLIKLGVSPQGGNYRVIHKAIEYFQIDTSHFLGMSANRGRKFGPKRNIEEYLSNKYFINSNSLRKRLFKEGLKTHQCEKCQGILWNNLPIPLELDHIDGNHKNNNLSNLRVLCPNCHAQTDTYRGKNKK